MTRASPGRVVHVYDNVPSAVYIGRQMPNYPASLFANLFKIGVKVFGIGVLTRDDAIRIYRLSLMQRPTAIARLPELRGKALACWCRHDEEPRTEENACHGDVLLEFLATYTDDELRAIAQGRRPWH